MLSFLRKIRKSLIGSGTVMNYLLYAIGEVVLVVIGILIALQINNWSEWNKDRILEKEILSELVENLEINAKELARIKKRGEDFNYSRNLVIHALQNRLPYHDSTSVHFLYSAMPLTDLNLSMVGYEMLKNEGFDLISSKELKKNIVQLFEVTFAYVIKRQNDNDLKPLEDELTVYFRKNFQLLTSPYRRIPLNYSDLIDDNYFIESLRAIVEYQAYLINQYADAQVETQKIMDLLKMELGELE